MDAMGVAAALRRASESCDGCQFASVARGTDDCSRFSCDECQDRFSAWLNDAADTIERCALPEGVEWPMFEDGEPVRLGDMALIDGDADMVEAVQIWIHGKPVIYGDNGSRQLEKGERVKRPAPKALDADGVEIHVGDVLYRKSDGRMVEVAEVYEKTFIDADGYVRPGNGFTRRAPVLAADGKPLEIGQTVWRVGDGVEFTVIGLPRSGEYQAVELRLDDGASTGLDPDQLTHQRPVLDADGVPIKVGDTVYVAPFDDPLTVRGFAADGRVLMDYHSDDSFGYSPENLTHAKPEQDTWERIEEDCSISERRYYAQRIGHDVGLKDDEGVHVAVSLDLVRRCKALAEKEAGR